MGEYLAAVIERRREEPGEDLISDLLAAEIDGERLGLRDLLGFSALLLIAGNETTTNLIGNAILCFDERPEAMDQLQAEPALMRTAIEEVLRYRSPVQAMFRTAVADTIIGDQEIKAGSTILAYIGSANRDGAVFEIPEQFDITRKPNRHIAFGYGIHRCLGAPLAQLEGRVALPMMLGRLAKIRRDRSVPLKPLDSRIMYGVKNLPITFAAA